MDYAFTFGSFSFGAGTVYGVTQVQGLNNPDVRTEIFQKANSSGAWVYNVDYPERHITISGNMVDTSNLETSRVAFDAAFIPSGNPETLSWTLGGVTYSIDCQPVWTHYDIAVGEYPQGLIRWAVEFVAEDPTITEESSS